MVIAKKPATRDSHEKRLVRVLKYVRENLDRSIDLDAVADVASLSRFHFHRVYKELTGETIGETVRRLRLERARDEVLSAKLGLDEIATRAGYQSESAFSRAFRHRWGAPPIQFARNSLQVQSLQSDAVAQSIKAPLARSPFDFVPDQNASLQVCTETPAVVALCSERLAPAEAFLRLTQWCLLQGVAEEDVSRVMIFARNSNGHVMAEMGVRAPAGAVSTDDVMLATISGGVTAVLTANWGVPALRDVPKLFSALNAESELPLAMQLSTSNSCHHLATVDLAGDEAPAIDGGTAGDELPEGSNFTLHLPLGLQRITM